MAVSSMLVAEYDSHPAAEEAVKALHRAGFNMRKASVIGRDCHGAGDVFGYYETSGRMKCWGAQLSFWGDLWGLLFDAAIFTIPEIGPVLAAGPVVSWLVDALEDSVAVRGLSPLGAALCAAGIPKDDVLNCETALGRDHLLLITSGTAGEIAKALGVIRATRPSGLNVHGLGGKAAAP